MTTTAVAHPIQGLVKYHGLRDPVRRLPFHDSLSVAVAPIHTRTTVAAFDGPKDRVVIDGHDANGRAYDRCVAVLDAVRAEAGSAARFDVDSRSDFPQKVGLGSSSSGFAALALAALVELGKELPLEAVSGIARLGAGSASRSATGWVSLWEHRSGLSRCLPESRQWRWPILMPLIPHEEPTEAVHEDVLGSPLFPCRLRSVQPRCAEAARAVAKRDLAGLLALAERDTLELHALTMTGTRGRITWQPATVAIMRLVWEQRDAGVPCWFSIDTGATPYVNVAPGHEHKLKAPLQKIDGVTRVIEGEPGPEAHIRSGV